MTIASKRFDEKWIPEPNTGCFLWFGKRKNTGYGIFWLSSHKRNVRAHRYAYERSFGKIPANMCICHRCDTPLCVNPEHLFLGTQLDNLKDMGAKGRRAVMTGCVGSAHGRAKINEETVSEIKQALFQGKSGVEISRCFGVHVSTVSNIKRKKQWTHV